MSVAYIALGANLNQPRGQIQQAIHLLNTLPHTSVIRTSSFYRSAPWGYLNQPDFINAVVALNTALTAEDLLGNLLALEQQCGRTRTFKNAPRTLDLDILLYDELVITTPHLTVPHPRMTERAFVMIPLQEIAPDLIIPQQGKVTALCMRFATEQDKGALTRLPLL
jgi:2-amino-4-hydroxy-6-hydroxymethyldihydropteridine diphosphokinase